MPLGLYDVRRLAMEVVRAQDDELEVVGVVTASGGSGYTEVLITSGCDSEECLMSVGLDRQTSEDAFRTRLAGKLNAQIQEQITRESR
jgi:hypothetical protein